MWLCGRKSLDWYLPISGTLEWKDKTRVAEIVVLNGSSIRVKIDDSQKVGRVIQTVGNKLGILSSGIWEYGLKFAGKLNAGLTDKDLLSSGWLETQKTLQEHGVTCSTKLELRWLKRWFVYDHIASSADEVGRNYTFLEVRNAFLKDVLDTNAASTGDVAKCIACLLFVDNGKFDKKKHTGQWFQGKRYVPESWSDIVNFSLISSTWKAFPEDAAPKRLFIEICRRFPGFGCTFFQGVSTTSREEKDKLNCQNAVVSLNKDGVTIYKHAVSTTVRGGASGAAVKNEKRLSRSALSLSPRGHDEELSDPNLRNVKTGTLGRAGSSGFMSMRRSSKKRAEEAALDDSGDINNINTSNNNNNNNNSNNSNNASNVNTGSSSPTSSMHTPTSPEGGAKSPRGGAFSRSFTMFNKKGSTGTLKGPSSSSAEKRGSIIGTGNETPPDLKKSGRFKSFASINILRKSPRGESMSSMHSPEAVADAERASSLYNSSGGSVGNLNEMKGSPDSRPMESRESSFQKEQMVRQALKYIKLEEIRSWGICGTKLVLDLVTVDSSDVIHLEMKSTEDALDFAEVIRGYCNFRMEEEISWHSYQVERTTGADMFGDTLSLRAIPVQLIGEIHARVRYCCNRVCDGGIGKNNAEALQTEMSALQGAIRVLSMSGNTSFAPRVTQSIQLIGALCEDIQPNDPSLMPLLRSSLESLSSCLACGFPETDESDEQMAVCSTLESLRSHAFVTALMFAALSNALHNLGIDSNYVDSLNDALIVHLEETVKRPVSVECHLKLARKCQMLSPDLADCCRIAKKKGRELQNASSATLTCFACYARDALSELIEITGRVDEVMVGGQHASVVDTLIKQLWDAESSLRNIQTLYQASAASESTFSKAVISLIKDIAMIISEDRYDLMASKVEHLVQTVSTVALTNRAVVPSKSKGGKHLNKRSQSSIYYALADVLSILISYVSDAYHRKTYAAEEEGV